MPARWLNPDRDVPRKVSPTRMRLWHAINEFCRQHGGAVVSVPGLAEIRIEIPQGSGLPAKLTDLGYAPHFHAMTTRIDAGMFKTVDVVTIMMPGK